MSYAIYRLCPFITFRAFKGGLATNNHIGILIVPLVINFFPLHFQARICYVFYACYHLNLLILTQCKLMTTKPQFPTNLS